MRAVAGHPVARSELGHAGADFQHPPDVAVAQGQRLIQPAEDRLQRRQEAVGADLLEHLLDLLGLAAGLGDQAGAAELDQHALGAGGNQAAGGLDEHVTRPDAGAGQIGYLDLAGPKMLEDLSQVDSPLAGSRQTHGESVRCCDFRGAVV
jgi:hypothetical protein